MGGYLAGTDSWFTTPDSQVSAHYGVGLNGEIHQYVAETMAAWANGILEAGNRWPFSQYINPNYRTISIETEDNGSGLTPVTVAQFEAVFSLCKGISDRWPITHLIAHDAISPHSRVNCPGPRWTADRMGVIAKALTLVLVL